MASASIFRPLSFLSICPLTVILPMNLWARLHLSQCFITLSCGVLPSSILQRLWHLPWHLLHILQLSNIKDYEARTVADVSVGVSSDACPSDPPTVPFDMMPPVSLTTNLTMDLSKISGRLNFLTHMVVRLLPSHPGRNSASPPTSLITNQGSDVPASDVLSTTSDSPLLFSTISRDNVLWLIHHKGAVLPPVCPCDTTNPSNKKTR